MMERQIPVSGESIPVIGLGTWQSFDVPPDSNLEALREVLITLSAGGRSVVDSSPMYGRSEDIIGILAQNTSDAFFYATKVWTTGKEEGIRQMEASFRKLKRPVIDLMQIHNLVDWKTHLRTLRKWKEEGKIRYIGITHYTDSMHEELAKIIRTEKIDFVQFNYSITDRNAEEFLFGTATEYGVATLINRPFGEGKLFRTVAGKELPQWAKEIDMNTWSRFFLKFIVSHPAVTCVIPATSNPAHAADNIKAGSGPLPGEKIRARMIEFIKGL